MRKVYLRPVAFLVLIEVLELGTIVSGNAFKYSAKTIAV